MGKFQGFTQRFGLSTLATLVTVLGSTAAIAQNAAIYNPSPIKTGQEVTDRLSPSDIPTGAGGFARDYKVNLEAGDQVVVDLTSEEFDTIVSLMDTDGTTVAENDDGPDGSTNSLLFTRIKDAGVYIVRVRAFGETAGGRFTLKVTRLRPVE